MKEYFWHLQEYKGQNTRFRCPQCGKAREYTRYVNSNNEYAPYEYGRCNRINSCGYFNYPNGIKTDAPAYNPIKQEQEFIDWNNYNFNLDINSDFIRYMMSYFNEDNVMRTLKKYYVRTSGDYMVFPYIDRNNRLTYVKSMEYKNGHRTRKIYASFKANKGVFKQCLFGQHLIDYSKPINIVEAEKTALICDVKYPEFHWVATGGQEMISKIDILKSGTIHADKGKAFEKWNERIDKSKFSMSKLMENTELPEGSDLADLIMCS